jgi:hypothetical protein
MHKKNVDWEHADTIFPKDSATQKVPLGAVKQSERMLIANQATRQVYFLIFYIIHTINNNSSCCILFALKGLIKSNFSPC